MKFISIVLGGFLLFASMFIIRDLVTDSEPVSAKKEEVYVQKIEDAKSETVEERKVFLASPAKLTVVRTMPKEDQETDHYDNVATVSVNQPSEEELEYKHMLLREKRKATIAEKQSYKKARVQWRIALNEARTEAVKSGDYTKYEALKRREPAKRKQSE